ncbi:MAG: dTDP-4-dehydrorhamnose reductase [Tannerella sp.]|jgi:dTDP-4-dehydrorhamnose reductase|nr:dTDP-4-dehydrorhamnose reductase [Tannerella sp.]
MESILITGANGQLGNALQNICRNDNPYFFHFTDIQELDICDKGELNDFVKARNVRLIVNCAAYTAVDRAEDEPDLCFKINRDAVRNIGEVAAENGAKVIHISTDYVFDGQGNHPYREDDSTAPQSVYGHSKLEGENALLSACKDSIIIRTAWLYSETGNNFVKTMLRLGAERDSIGVVNDQQGTPTYAGDLAKAIQTIWQSVNFIPGIYHYTNEGVCTWYDFAVKIFELSGLPCLVKPLQTAEYPTKAKRPAYSVLDKTKIRETYSIHIPEWEESLDFVVQSLKFKVQSLPSPPGGSLRFKVQSLP